MSKFFFIEMGTPNAIIEGFHEIREGAIPSAELHPPYSFSNPISRQLYRARYSRRARRLLRFIPHEWWSRWHAIRTLKLSSHDTNYIVLMPGTDIERLILPKLLREVRDRPGTDIRLILLLFDPIHSPLTANGWNEVRSIFHLFDIVATFDKRDAEQYGLMHFTDPYAPRTVEDHEELRTDVFFIGHEKGRLDRLCDIADHLRSAGIQFRILVAGVSDQERAIQHGLTPIEGRTAYPDVLKYVVASRCLLEVLCDGQASSSLRYYEAVVYNKKLLTDNKQVADLPKFSPDYVQYFAEVSDIDSAWIRESCVVDYGYTDEFSAARLMDMIESATTDVRRSP